MSRRTRKGWFAGSIALAALVPIFLGSCADRFAKHAPDEQCDAEEIRADRKTSAPRPDIALATFSFDGNMPGQVNFVFVQPDGSYDYVEQWEAGDPRMLESGPDEGWTWKVGCRMHRCPMPDGGHCCHQVCRDGGRARFAYEPADAFACMNSAAGGKYDSFVGGLRAGGMSELSVCDVAAGDP